MLKLLATIDRYSRWILLVIILLYIITAYGMTKGIMDRSLAKKIHTVILPIPLFLLFLLHTLFPIRTQLIKWRIFKNQRATDSFAYAVILIFLVFFLWLYFR